MVDGKVELHLVHSHKNICPNEKQGSQYRTIQSKQ